MVRRAQCNELASGSDVGPSWGVGKQEVGAALHLFPYTHIRSENDEPVRLVGIRSLRLGQGLFSLPGHLDLGF